MDSELISIDFTSIAINLILAVGAFILGYLLVRTVFIRLLQQYLRQSGIDEVFVRYATSIATIITTLFVALIALDIAGIDTSILLPVLAGLLLAIIAAMQGWLQDVAAGLQLFLTKPFRLNDMVNIAGHEGRVVKIHFLTTTLRTGDNLIVTLPNRTVTSNIITNFHAQTERRIELVVEISYTDDIKTAIGVLRDVVMSDERVLAEPEPTIAVADLSANGIKLDVRPWVKQGDFSDTRYALREKIKYALDANQITIPYPQLTIHTTDET